MPPRVITSTFDPSSTVGEGSYDSQADPSFTAVKKEWQNPTDILAILTIIGGDVVLCALAQLIGTTFFITPVAFSFGWVAYSFSSILAAVGTGRITPESNTDVDCVNVKSRYHRSVKSWALSRLYRDLIPRPAMDSPSLTIQFYETLEKPTMGVRSRDGVFYLSLFAIFLQIGIACIPGALQDNWVPLIITIGGTALAQCHAALPQWESEMWRARDVDPKKTEVVCLTAGNGSSHVVVIKSNGCGRRLEDLASGRIVPSHLTSMATLILTILWILHMMVVQSINDGGWYLLAIGGIGMAQNVIAAGARRSPAALGFHIKEWAVDDKGSNTISKRKAFETIQAAEEVEGGLGLELCEIFFPGGNLRPAEEECKSKAEEEWKSKTEEEWKSKAEAQLSAARAEAAAARERTVGTEPSSPVKVSTGQGNELRAGNVLHRR